MFLIRFEPLTLIKPGILIGKPTKELSEIAITLVILYIFNRYTIYIWSHFRFDLEVHRYNVDNSVDDTRIDTYWNSLSDLYPMMWMSIYSILIQARRKHFNVGGGEI